jgi:hypothetical protein
LTCAGGNLDIQNVVEGREAVWMDNPDLSRVEEIGFTDLMREPVTDLVEVRGSTGFKFPVSRFHELLIAAPRGCSP